MAKIWQWIMEALFQSLVLYFVVHLSLGGGQLMQNGKVADDIWQYGSTVFGAAVCVVNLRLAVATRYWLWVHHLFIWGSILSWWTFLAICSDWEKQSDANVGFYGMSTKCMTPKWCGSPRCLQ